jgi:RluA family pseudouridine synthase
LGSVPVARRLFRSILSAWELEAATGAAYFRLQRSFLGVNIPEWLSMQIRLADLVLWEAEEFLVINKPAGLPTLVDGYHKDAPYLLGVLRQAYDPLWVVHRLDRDTSGVMVFARTSGAHRELNIQFEKRQAVKSYHALVASDLPWNEKTVKLALRPDGDRKHRTVVDARHGKPALTELRVLRRFGTFYSVYSLVEAIPHTGRTHQIRVHMAAQGYPIVADRLYGDGRGVYLSDLKIGFKGQAEAEKPLLGRMGLHARSITLLHPVTGEQLCFEAPYPKDFIQTLRWLRRANLGR